MVRGSMPSRWPRVNAPSGHVAARSETSARFPESTHLLAAAFCGANEGPRWASNWIGYATLEHIHAKRARPGRRRARRCAPRSVHHRIGGNIRCRSAGGGGFMTARNGLPGAIHRGWRAPCTARRSRNTSGWNWIMRDSGMSARGPLGRTQPRLRRRQIGGASVGAVRVARNGPAAHLIGLGILLSAALLIAIGSFSAPARSTAKSAAAEGAIAAADAQDRTR